MRKSLVRVVRASITLLLLGCKSSPSCNCSLHAAPESANSASSASSLRVELEGEETLQEKRDRLIRALAERTELPACVYWSELSREERSTFVTITDADDVDDPAVAEIEIQRANTVFEEDEDERDYTPTNCR